MNVQPLWGGKTALVSSSLFREKKVRKRDVKRGEREIVQFGILTNKLFGRLPSVKPGPQFVAPLATAYPLCIMFGTVLYLFVEGRAMRTGVSYRPPGQACRGYTGAIPANKVRRLVDGGAKGKGRNIIRRRGKEQAQVGPEPHGSKRPILEGQKNGKIKMEWMLPTRDMSNLERQTTCRRLTLGRIGRHTTPPFVKGRCEWIVDWWLSAPRPGNHRSTNIRTSTRRPANGKAEMARLGLSPTDDHEVQGLHQPIAGRFRDQGLRGLLGRRLSVLLLDSSALFSASVLTLFPPPSGAPSRATSVGKSRSSSARHDARTGSPLCCSPTIFFLALSFVGLTRRASCTPGWLAHRYG
jgi:hypothetical protein